MPQSTTRTAGILIPPPGGGKWQEHHGDVYRCPVIVRGEAGRYSAAAVTLAGITAEGATENEALAKIAQLLSAEIARHKDARQPIPWIESASPPSAGLLRWVICRIQGTGR